MSEPTPTPGSGSHRLRCRIDHPRAAAALRLIPRHLAPTFVAHCILWALDDPRAMLPWAPYLGESAPGTAPREASPSQGTQTPGPKGPPEPDLSFLGGFGTELAKGPRP